jgi:hypothetical protein
LRGDGRGRALSAAVGCFDAIVGQTHDHFWDPHHLVYLDFTAPFDLEDSFTQRKNVTVNLNTPPPA